jgi:hypothetical protein
MMIFSSGAVFAADPTGEVPESATARQLRINKTVLLQGPTVENRNDAAMELLLSSDPGARLVITETLVSNENPAARRAICDSLISTRITEQKVVFKFDLIEPLIVMLSDEKSENAKLAAEAMLIFDFNSIQARLETLALSAETPKHVKLNLMYALKLLPADKEAIAVLVKLLDDSDQEIVLAAAEALPYWIPIGRGSNEILRDLKRKSQSEIIRERMIYLEEAIRKITEEKNSWQDLYLESLDKVYESSDDTQKGSLLYDKIKAKDPVIIKLWPLEKISKSPPSVVFPDGFSQRLLELISDPGKKVRLKTANVLTVMSNLNQAEQLLAQLNVEKNSEVKLAIFSALGEACYFSLLSASPETPLSSETRRKTLAQALRYLDSKDPEESKTGAVVLRNLLEPNGLGKEVINAYLEKILFRYEATIPSEDVLRGNLLNVMAKLAGLSATREGSAKLFEKEFFTAVEPGQPPLVRQAGVLGLTNIDKAIALTHLVTHAMYNDQSAIIVHSILKLATEVGKQSDLDWLVNKIDSNGQADLAWKAMHEILMRQDAMVSVEWAEKMLSKKNAQQRVAVIIEIAERKASAEDNAAEVTRQVNNRLKPALLELYLKSGDNAHSAAMISKHLVSIGDLGDKDKTVEKLKWFFASQNIDIEKKKKLLDTLNNIKAPAGDAKWKVLLDNWTKQIKPPVAAPVEPIAPAIPATPAK